MKSMGYKTEEVNFNVEKQIPPTASPGPKKPLKKRSCLTPLPLHIKIPRQLFADLWLTSNLSSLGCHVNVRIMESQRQKELKYHLILPVPTPDT